MKKTILLILGFGLATSTLLAGGLVNLHTKEYRLAQANDALHDLHHGKIHGRAVLIP